MLDEIDVYIREHDGTDRSQIVDEALRCWYSGQLREALTRQHSAAEAPEELEERSAWKGIRAARVERLGRKYAEDERP